MDLPGVPANVITLALAASAITQMIIDGIRINTPFSSRWAVVLAFVLSQATVTLLIVSAGGTVLRMSEQQAATMLLSGLIASGFAIGSNRLSTKAKETVDAQLYRP